MQSKQLPDYDRPGLCPRYIRTTSRATTEPPAVLRPFVV